jgi:hypothetical protein
LFGVVSRSFPVAIVLWPMSAQPPRLNSVVQHLLGLKEALIGLLTEH